MGITEEAGSTARRGIAILSGAPMLFALVLVNFAAFAMMTYLVVQAVQLRAEERKSIMMMLERCYVPLPQARDK